MSWDFVSIGGHVLRRISVKALGASATPGQYTTAIGSDITDTLQHGTCMLDQMAGYQKGVAPNIMPVLFTMNVRDSDPRLLVSAF